MSANTNDDGTTLVFPSIDRVVYTWDSKRREWIVSRDGVTTRAPSWLAAFKMLAERLEENPA